MIAFGVPLGAKKPYQLNSSGILTPTSVSVGISGSSLARSEPGHRQRAHLAGADVGDRAAHRAEIDFGAAGDQVVHALRHLAVGHVLHLGAGDIHEQHGREVRGRADADRVVVQLAGIGLGVVDHLLDRLERRHGRDLEHLARARHQHDRLEALDRIERGRRRQRHVHRQRLRAEVQRVAVGRARPTPRRRRCCRCRRAGSPRSPAGPTSGRACRR